MIVTPVKTHKITARDKDLFAVLDKYVLNLKEGSVLAITSKIVSITEGRLARMEDASKDELIKQEAQFYIPRGENPYDVSFAIAHNMLAAGAGIDESNGNGYYILWPHNPQKSANKIREYLKKRFKLKNVGVIITDSRTMPMRWGVTGVALSYSGFKPLKNYVGREDLFGRKFEFEKTSMIDSLATASTVVMGEGSEQTPMALIEDIPFVEFQDKNPTEKELKSLQISIDKDLYGPFLKSAKWKKGSAK